VRKTTLHDKFRGPPVKVDFVCIIGWYLEIISDEWKEENKSSPVSFLISGFYGRHHQPY
jgi:hypothetical protein